MTTNEHPTHPYSKSYNKKGVSDVFSGRHAKYGKTYLFLLLKMLSFYYIYFIGKGIRRKTNKTYTVHIKINIRSQKIKHLKNE